VGAGGPMGDENDFALAMNVALPISFFLSRTAKSWKKGLLLIASLLFVLGNIVSESRGGFLALVAVGGGCWLYSKHKIRTFIIVLLLALIGWNFSSPQFKAEVSGIGVESAESDTGKDRIELWKVGWRAFKDNPILGVGQGNMPIVMEIYQYDEFGVSYWKRGLWGRAIHSVYFTMLPELGTAGSILILMIFKELVRNFRKTGIICRKIDGNYRITELKNMNIALSIAIVGYILTGIFISAFYYPEFWNLSALAVALHLAIRNSAPQYTL
jgi:O-antigen ligase